MVDLGFDPLDCILGALACLAFTLAYAIWVGDTTLGWSNDDIPRSPP